MNCHYILFAFVVLAALLSAVKPDQTREENPEAKRTIRKDLVRQLIRNRRDFGASFFVGMAITIAIACYQEYSSRNSQSEVMSEFSKLKDSNAFQFSATMTAMATQTALLIAAFVAIKRDLAEIKKAVDKVNMEVKYLQKQVEDLRKDLGNMVSSSLRQFILELDAVNLIYVNNEFLSILNNTDGVNVNYTMKQLRQFCGANPPKRTLLRLENLVLNEAENFYSGVNFDYQQVKKTADLMGKLITLSALADIHCFSVDEHLINLNEKRRQEEIKRRSLVNDLTRIAKAVYDFEYNGLQTAWQKNNVFEEELGRVNRGLKYQDIQQYRANGVAAHFDKKFGYAGAKFTFIMVCAWDSPKRLGWHITGNSYHAGTLTKYAGGCYWGSWKFHVILMWSVSQPLQLPDHSLLTNTKGDWTLRDVSREYNYNSMVYVMNTYYMDYVSSIGETTLYRSGKWWRIFAVEQCSTATV